VFGYVTDGIEAVDKICDATPVVDRNGTVMKDDQPVITAVRVL
jgi:peptidyl-prolyl cis-trans isomerase B (cyclophilin B)